MCGIFGLISAGKTQCNASLTDQLVRLFYTLSESRGKEASGIALLLNDRLDIVKAPVRGRDFLAVDEVRPLLEMLTEAMQSNTPVAFMGHTRMATNGGEHLHGNNQPVIRNGFVAIHNGIVVNDSPLWQQIPEEARQYEVDTEVILALVSHHLKAGVSFLSAVEATMDRIRGANTIALMSADHDEMVLATSNGSMFVVHQPECGLILFASERIILERIIEGSIRKWAPIDERHILQLLPGQLTAVPIGECQNPLSNSGTMLDRARRRITDHFVVTVSPAPKPTSINRSRVREIEQLTNVEWDAIRTLRRCTRCILPATFPFIHFDESGVCNVCNSHTPLKLKGEVLLRNELESSRRSDGRPEILFPISGGRDSCYGLHLLVKKFNIKPVAYTYDWGMVTDLARRNISRMCGELGIEHVLISADIRRKREFIRQNVSAWLKKPHLGTVPLFMAGDKQFFFYANMLKREMRLSRTLFSMNPLERTDFKVGFCGIDETYQKERHYDPKLINKLRLGTFYAGQFLSNPGFINASLFDSAFAYFSYYLITKDFASIFDYLPWQEEDIEQVLLGEYDWELSPDTKSTWRIGDGTAAFYNYIYLKVAGFSENDTFRSNQIREGLITREKGLRLVYEDNRPRSLSIASYFDLIDLDAIQALRTVNTIASLCSPP